VEEILAALAFSAHGLVTRRQLLHADISREEIRSRLANGALLLEYPGVYRVGHRAPSLESRYLAAVLACGDRALLNGCAAGYLLGVLKGPEPPPQVIAPSKRSIGGVLTRRYRILHPGDAMKWRAIPVTSVERTLVDLASVLSPDDLARACHEALVRELSAPGRVETILARRPNSPGAANLRAVLFGDIRVTLSELEDRFLEHLRDADHPLPETNRPSGGRYVDCRWPQHRLTVELDSYRYHKSRLSWEADHRREREAYARGDQFRRYTWGDVFEHPRLMMRELNGLLGGSDPM
jgi:hypothetical protein